MIIDLSEIRRARGMFSATAGGEASAILSSVDHAIRDTGDALKKEARAYVAATLNSRRAGFLITGKYYPNRPGKAAYHIHGRWFRRKAGGGEPQDILAAHTYGAIIRPVEAQRLYIPVGRGRLARRERLAANLSGGRVTIQASRNGRSVIIQRGKTRRARTRLIATLAPEVTLPARLTRLPQIYQEAGEMVPKRALDLYDRRQRVAAIRRAA